MSKKALDDPRRLKLANGEWVGVGGPITIKGIPPARDAFYREATPAEYVELAQRGNILVKLVN